MQCRPLHEGLTKQKKCYYQLQKMSFHTNPLWREPAIASERCGEVGAPMGAQICHKNRRSVSNDDLECAAFYSASRSNQRGFGYEPSSKFSGMGALQPKSEPGYAYSRAHVTSDKMVDTVVGAPGRQVDKPFTHRHIPALRSDH